jgi:hypothetical protein
MTKRIQKLTTEEIKLLNDLTTGYGKLTEASELTSLHAATIRTIRTVGHGEPESISTLRKKLLSKHKSKIPA